MIWVQHAGYNTLQHTATHCNTLQHTATHCNTLHHPATPCNTLQHAATHCNTLQNTATHLALRAVTLALVCTASSIHVLIQHTSVTHTINTPGAASGHARARLEGVDRPCSHSTHICRQLVLPKPLVSAAAPPHCQHVNKFRHDSVIYATYNDI